ncbi:MAG: 2Fe-2S iron-sulfur cluster-binding protein [Anaerolineales bacterium]
MIHLTIDDKSIEATAGRTLLEACRENGIQIPTLCYHPALEPYGACRLCVVEIYKEEQSSRLVAACAYPCEEGLNVKTNSKAVQRNRRVVAELLLASGYDTPEIVALASEFGVKEARYKMPQADSCIICGLCVRACKEIVGISAISLINRGINKKVSPPFEETSPTCIGCGTCVLICPTGYIKLRDVFGSHSIYRYSSDYDRAQCRICSDLNMSSKFNQLIEGVTSDAASYGISGDQNG